MSFPTRRQKIAIIGLFLVLTMARMPTLIEESLWFNIGFLVGQAVAVAVVVWGVGRLKAAVSD
jgi:hypothetical protein